MGPLPRSLAPGGASLADVVVPGGRCGREAWSLGRPGRERRTRPLAASRWFGFSVPQQDPIRGVTERGRGGAMGAGLGPVGAAGGWARGERGPDSAGSVSCCPIGVWASRPAPAPCPPGLAWRWQERAASRPPRASQPGLGQIPAPVFGRLSDWRSVQGGLSPVPAPPSPRALRQGGQWPAVAKGNRASVGQALALSEISLEPPGNS